VVHRWGGGSGVRANKSIYYHIGRKLHGGISKLMAMHVCRSFWSTTWSSHCSSDLARSVSRHRWSSSLSTAALGARERWMLWSEDVGPEMLDLLLFPDFVNEMRWWSIATRGRPPISVPHRHVSCCLQCAYSSTHEDSLVMVLHWIWRWWTCGISFNVRLGGAKFCRWPLDSANANTPRDGSVFIIL
jgi:hypothetical protein